MKQKTIKKEFELTGEGLHTGCQVHAKFRPAGINSGIYFVRMDLPHKPQIKAAPENVNIKNSLPRCTTIGHQDAIVHTVEHVIDD
jgi:UDP-3-O-acyl-N-acetylglucosamine deacetylase